MKKYDIEFKKMIVGFYEDGKPVKELSKEYDINEVTSEFNIINFNSIYGLLYGNL